jgi:hypothetical protein
VKEYDYGLQFLMWFFVCVFLLLVIWKLDEIVKVQREIVTVLQAIEGK